MTAHEGVSTHIPISLTSSDCVCTVQLSSSFRLVTSFCICTVVTPYIVTQLVTGYGSTHNASVTIFTMADLTEVASLLQQLLTTVASHSDILSVLSAQRNNIFRQPIMWEDFFKEDLCKFLSG